MPGDEASVELQYLGLQCPQLTAECSHTRAGYLGEPVVGCIGDDFQQALDTRLLVTGFGLPDDALHSPNERMSLDQYHRGIEAVIHLMHELAQERT